MIAKQLTYTLDTIANAAAGFWDMARAYPVITFSGEMGAGKTTFISHLCRHLQVQQHVSSPTFALINEYVFEQEGKEVIIFHLDWYRLRDAAEAINAGMEDCIDQARSGGAYCLIEWPEKAPELLQPPYLAISIESIAMEERSMTMQPIETLK
jgi:tRNA threonylcarbamoyladenosine biosynthesis protein TsaE